MMSESYPNPAEGIERINADSAEAIQAAARLLLGNAIVRVHGSMELHLGVDADQHQKLAEANYPSGESLDIFVREDEFTAPRNKGELSRTFSVRLVPPISTGEKPFMKLHIPAGELRVNEYQMPQLDTVQEIYIEDVGTEDTHWYTVNKERVYEYIPELYTEDDEPVISDQGIWLWLDERVSESIVTIARLSKQITNWKTKPQRTIILPETGSAQERTD